MLPNMYLFLYLLLIVFKILYINSSNLLIISVYKTLCFIYSVAIIYIRESRIGFSLIFSDLTRKSRFGFGRSKSKSGDPKKCEKNFAECHPARPCALAGIPSHPCNSLILNTLHMAVPFVRWSVVSFECLSKAIFDIIAATR